MYKVVIGLEVHCELDTNSKNFSTAKNTYSSDHNEHVEAVDLGLPGTLPVLNKEAVKKALKTAIALNCENPDVVMFDRKNYYYPDLPKGYQITQETKPIPSGIYGYVEYECKDELKKVRINNIHLEEDAASLDHFSSVSCIDYNRAGVPLLELVTEPDIHSADEAVAFLEHMRRVYQYANISEADSKKGQVRCDVNVSIMPSNLDETDPNNWGTKIEVKNVNSFGGVRDAINYEIERQINLKEDGEYDIMEQQTRRWDEESGSTIYMRSKVDAVDYKYFVEPNIPKYKVTQKLLDEVRNSIPRLASERKQEYMEKYGLSKYDATILVKEKAISDYFEKALEENADPKLVSNWITSIILGHINKYEVSINELFLTPNMLASLIELVQTGKISSKQGKEVLYKALEDKIDPVKIVSESGMQMLGDEDTINKVVKEVLMEQPGSIEQYKNGRTNIVDFLVGQVMKKTKGQANPAMTRNMMIEEIERS